MRRGGDGSPKLGRRPVHATHMGRPQLKTKILTGEDQALTLRAGREEVCGAKASSGGGGGGPRLAQLLELKSELYCN